jgi:transposase
LSGRINARAFEKSALELVADHPRIESMVRPMLIARAVLREQFAVLHRMLLTAVREDDTCRRLMTVPGVGAVTAITFATTIDDPDRFHRSRDVGAHLGLTPRKYASGEVDRNGRISKTGDAPMRAVLYQASLALLTRSQRWCKLRAWGMAVAKRLRSAARRRRRVEETSRAHAPNMGRRERVPVEYEGGSRLRQHP